MPPSDATLSPIRAALRFLAATQLDVDQTIGTRMDYAGSWPQCVDVRGRGDFVRDVSPFMATFIHHALSRLTESSREPLALEYDDVEAARRVRRAAIELMLRFAAAPDAPDAGTYGFWPTRMPQTPLIDALLTRVWMGRVAGPIWFGVRSPVNLPLFPPQLRIPTDADDTAAIYAALLDHVRLDGGMPVTTAFEGFFADWRDHGQAPRRNDAPWLPDASGAFLTWLAYGDDPLDPGPNDVDVVVNANVLFALGVYERLETPGVLDAVAVINDAIAAGAHRTPDFTELLYYPSNPVVHYCITRAFCEGGVQGLRPAVDRLVDDLLATAQADATGRVFWDRGQPHLDTACALLALMHAEHDDEILDRGIEYLIAQQDPNAGGWDAGAFFGGRLDDGSVQVWVSPALTTALALEALAEYTLSDAR